jgi:ATP-dependent DNA helicase RecQ
MPKPKKTKAKSSSSRGSAARLRRVATAKKVARRSGTAKPKAKPTRTVASSAKGARATGRASRKSAAPSLERGNAPARSTTRAPEKLSAKRGGARTTSKTSAKATSAATARAKASARLAAAPAPKKAAAERPSIEPRDKTRSPAPALRKVPGAPSKPLLIGDVVKARPTRAPGPPQTVAPSPSSPPGTLSSKVPAPITVRSAAARRAPDDRALARVAEMGRRLGYPALHPALEQLVQAGLAGKDALGIVRDNDDARFVALATAPEIAEPCLFVSPSSASLRALEARALELGVPTVRLETSVLGAERARALGRIAKGGPLLVLAGAAELRSRDLAQACSRVGVGLALVDEAHVASAFGHELRPSVAEIAQSLVRLGRPALVALTRPVPAAARQDLIERLGLRHPDLFQLPLVREQVALASHVARGEVRQARLVELLSQLAPPGIIFCALPHDVDSVYAALGAMRLPAHRHHAGLAPAERTRELEAWAAPSRRAILVATSGFSSPSGVLGLGEEGDPTVVGFGRCVPRRDVRFVLHYQAPASLDQYVREIALAGRDGERADAVLLYESAHRSLNDALLAQQRFRPQHVLDLSRALEAAELEGKPLTVEALALSSGQSRRTMERLTALLSDAGLIEKASNCVRPLASTAELGEGCRRLSARLEELRAQDARRLEAVTDYAEANTCRHEALSAAFGVAQAPCGRCSVCAPQPFDRQNREALPLRRPAVQSFSVGPATGSVSGEATSPHSSPLAAKLGEFQGH